MMEDPDVNLLVPVKAVTDEFVCPICFEVLEDVVMTNCSHNFCKKCILECLNRKKVCPCCNTAATPQQLQPNKQFERVISILIEEREKASKEYFTALINNGGNPAPSNGLRSSKKPIVKERSPIEQIFQTHLQKVLGSYEEYYQKLKAKTQSWEQQTIEKFKSKPSNPITQKEMEDRIAEIRILQQSSTELLTESLENFLKSTAPPSEIFSIIVKVAVPTKNLAFDHVLHATDTCKDVKKQIETRLEKLDPILEWQKGNIFTLVGFMGGNPVLITDDSLPILLTFHPEPGAVLTLQGKLKCKSDAPKQCMKSVFNKDNPTPVEYSTCKTCKNTNWICQSCVETCHKGHQVVPYLTHTPTWACCYCVKVGCSLFKK